MKFLIGSSLLLISAAASAAQAPRVLQNVVVYREANRFAGWPANHGAWIWNKEIVVQLQQMDAGAKLDVPKPHLMKCTAAEKNSVPETP